MIVNKLLGVYNSRTLTKYGIHALFWVVYFTLNVLRWGYYFGDFSYSFRSNLVEFPIHILLVYFNLYFLLPRLIPRRIGWYILCLFAAVWVMSFVRVGVTYELVTTDIYRESIIEQQGLYNVNYMVAVFIGELYVVGLTMAIKLTIDWVRSEKKSRELEQRNLETELSMLRSQMQPHFFFNTLNNLYALTLEKSDQAPETVLKLSELMSYVVYKGKESKVELIQEIEHLHNYLNLERLRYDHRLDLNFTIDGKLDDFNVPPLILVTFVENAFKHGSSNKLGAITIDIHLKIEEGWIHYTVSNDYKRNGVKHKGRKAKGIGIENTKRRLDLLFKNEYQLDIKRGDNKFFVGLSIPTL